MGNIVKAMTRNCNYSQTFYSEFLGLNICCFQHLNHFAVDVSFKEESSYHDDQNAM